MNGVPLNQQYEIDTTQGIEIGISTIGAHLADPLSGKKISEQARVRELIDAAVLADELGLDVIAVGESHEEHFVTAAHTVILGAIASTTRKVKLLSSVSVLSTADPVRLYEDFATLDLISGGRAEIVCGRGSRLGAFSVLGFNESDYEALFEEKLDLLLQINGADTLNWQGRFRQPLQDITLYPQPLRGKLPILRAVGGSPESVRKAAEQGVPMILTTLAGPSVAFKDAIDSYRRIAQAKGFDLHRMPVTTTGWFHAAPTDAAAVQELHPYIDGMGRQLRRQGFPLDFVRASTAQDQAMMVGSPETIIKKMIHQHRLYGQQRFLAHLDIGAMPWAMVKRNIELLAREIMPAVKEATRASA